jgi:serpin B
MHTQIRSFALFFLIAACVLCYIVGPAMSEVPQIDLAEVLKAANAAALDFYGKLATKDGNLFFSPCSIHTALSMTYAGAAGNTAQQMAATLHLPPKAEMTHAGFKALMDKLNHPSQVPVGINRGDTKTEPAYQLTVANALWGQKGFPFKQNFMNLLSSDYGAALKYVDYLKPDEAREIINKWAQEATRDKISSLIPPGVLHPSNRLVLTNAIYFKSNWAEQFQKLATKDGHFKLSDGKQVSVPMMNRMSHLGYMEAEGLQAVELPYKSNDLSMIVLLPGKTDGLQALEKSLASANLSRWLAGLKRANVDLTMPRFKFAGEFMLADVLKALGMTDAFNPAKADFSGMTAEEKLFIAAVIHKAFVAVDEDGTEAAAATAITMRATAMRPDEEKPKVFNADHPFVFLIRHNATGAILFMGRLSNPKA